MSAMRNERFGDEGHTMNTSMKDLATTGFALFQSPVKKGSDGKATLRGAEATLNGKTLNGSAIKAGRVEWFPQDKLKFKNASYKAMDRLVQSYGIAWGAGTLVPLGKLAQLMTEFETLRHKFMQEVDFLHGNYDLYIEAHKATQTPAVQEVIQAVRLPWDAFRSSFRITVPTPSVFHPMTDDLQGTANQIVDVAMEEIAEQAQSIQEKILGKSQVDPKSLGPIKRLVEKCRDFSVLHPAFRSFADEFDTLSANLLPPIVGDKQVKLVAYLGVLSDPKAISTWMNNHQADLDLDDNTLEAIFGHTTAAQPTQPVAPVFTPAPQTTVTEAVEPTVVEQPVVEPVVADSVTTEPTIPEYDWETFGL